VNRSRSRERPSRREKRKLKIRIPARGLSRALSVVTRAAGKGGSGVAVLSGALFEAAGGSLRISATDGEIGMTLVCSTAVEREGRVAVPARMVSELVRSLAEGELALEATDGRAEISLKDHSYSVRTYPAGDFPELPGFPAEDAFEVSAGRFSEAVSKVLPCASSDDSRPVLCGVLFSFSGGKVTLAATDSYRLALFRDGLEGSPAVGDVEVVVPAKALGEAVRLAGMAKEKISVALRENTAFFRAAGVTLSARLVAGGYPDYRKLLPDSFSKEFAVEAKALSDTLRRVNLFASRRQPPAPVKLSFGKGEGTLEGGTLEVAVEGNDVGSATEKIGLEVAEDFVAYFNGEYLLDAVKAAATGRVRLRFNEPMQPAMIVPGGEEGDGENFAYLIMPMRGPGEAPRGGSGKP
jgi:DNA polymerase-3 subunit beta